MIARGTKLLQGKTYRQQSSKASHLLRIGLLSSFVLLLFCSWTPIARVHAATSTGSISGRLLDGTNKNAPLAGQKVTLQTAQGSNAGDLASVTTDAKGAYTFANLATDKSITYALYTRYLGAQYNSNIISLASKPAQQVDLTVYQTTSSTANIAVVRATILLHAPDVQKGEITVSELFIFRSLDNRTFVGSLDASKGKPNALRFSLPHTARNVVLGKAFSNYNAIEVDRGFASDAAIPPGDSQYDFTFTMPYTASDYDFDYTVVYPTVQLTVLLPPAIHASSDTLVAKGPVTSDQQTFNLFQANALAARKEVHLQLQGLPVVPLLPTTPDTSNSSPTFTTGNLFFLILLLLMAVIVAVTWFIYRSTHRAAVAQKKPRSQQNKQRVVAKNSSGKAASEEALLQQLLELDKAYEAGTLTKAEYQERRAKTKAQLRAALREKVVS